MKKKRVVKRKPSVKAVLKRVSKKVKKAASFSYGTRRELGGSARQERGHIEKSIISASQSRQNAKETGEQIKFDIKTHKLEKGDLDEAMHEVEELQCAVDDIDFLVKEAEKVQKKKKAK